MSAQKNQKNDESGLKAKEINEIRRENAQLKKQVKKLRRHAEKLSVQPETYQNDYPDDNDIEEAPAKAPSPTNNVSKVPSKCPKCDSSQIGTYRSPGGKVLIGCRTCKKFHARL